MINNFYFFSFFICVYPYTMCIVYYITIQNSITLILVELKFFLHLGSNNRLAESRVGDPHPRLSHWGCWVGIEPRPAS